MAEFDLNPDSVATSTPHELGAGIYATRSLFNHSCDPAVWRETSTAIAASSAPYVRFGPATNFPTTMARCLRCRHDASAVRSFFCRISSSAGGRRAKKTDHCTRHSGKWVQNGDAVGLLVTRPFRRAVPDAVSVAPKRSWPNACRGFANRTVPTKMLLISCWGAVWPRHFRDFSVISLICKSWVSCCVPRVPTTVLVKRLSNSASVSLSWPTAGALDERKMLKLFLSLVTCQCLWFGHCMWLRRSPAAPERISGQHSSPGTMLIPYQLPHCLVPQSVNNMLPNGSCYFHVGITFHKLWRMGPF